MNIKTPDSEDNCIVDSDSDSQDIPFSNHEEIEVIEISDDEDIQPEVEGAIAVEDPPEDDSSLVFSKHNGAVFCCDLQPFNGSLAVSGGQDDMAYVWDINSGEVYLTCTDHRDSVTSVGFNHDGTYIATGDISGYIQVWNVSTKTQICETEIGDISWMTWHPGANVLLAAAISGDVYMWKIPGMSCKVLPGYNMRSECGRILPDGNRLAVGYDDGSLKVFDMKRSTVLSHVPSNPDIQDSVLSMDCHLDNNLLLYGNQNSHAYVMKTQTGKVVCRFDCSDPLVREGVEAVGFCKDPSSSWAATGTLGGTLTIWDISREAKRNLHQQDEGITKLLWMNNNLVITGCTSGIIKLYDSRSGNVEKAFYGHSKDIFDLVLSRDNRIVLSTSDDKTVRVFNISTE